MSVFDAGQADASFTDEPLGRDIAVKAGNNIIQLDEAEVARWKEAAQPVIARWVAEMDKQGLDGQALIDRARARIAANTK